MPESKISKALKLNPDEMEVILIGREDNSMNGEAKYKRVQASIAKMILLGKKRGRPNKEEESNEVAA
jgi:hypothetical protein